MRSDRPTVVLLHGLARTARSFGTLRRFLEKHGYDTWATTYPSRRLGVEAAAEHVAAAVTRDLAGRPLMAITHSLGGILVRVIGERVGWQRVLMLAPPNAGSAAAAAFRRNPLVRWFYGPAAHDLVGPLAWPAPRAPFAVIAGTLGTSVGNPTSWVGPLVRVFPPGEPNDGTVSVSETRHPEMADFAEVRASHTWIMNHPRVRELALRFLASGRFQ